MKKALLTVEEAARVLDIPPAQLHELLARGELPVVRIGNAARIPTAAVQQRIAQRVAFSLPNTAAEPDGGETRT